MSQKKFIASVQNIFKGKNPPFLFVGSGFSRRHLGLNDFKGLLKATCLPSMKPFAYYLSTASSELPQVALSIALDFQEKVWSDDSCKDFLDLNSKSFKSNTDAYKFYVAQILKEQQSKIQEINFCHYAEIEAIKKATIDAIITTNYDNLLEEIFPDFKVFLGQDELIQNNPQFIGEIYKIHGCVSNPKSIVITSEDYAKFDQKNKYLTAKLLSSFVERPIIFIGYSVQDRHIQEIIKSVVSCFTNNIDKIRGNFIFIKRSNREIYKCIESTFVIDGLHIPYYSIETDNFGLVYEQINSQRKIPASMMRIIKEQIYEIALTTETDKKIKVIDPEKLESATDIEFVVGIGVSKLAEKGYESISREDLCKDILLNGTCYDSEKLLPNTIAKRSKNAKFVPAYKYASMINKFDTIPKKFSELKKQDYASHGKQYENVYKTINNKTVTGIIKYAETEKNNILWALHIIPLLPLDGIKNEIGVLEDFLKQLLKKGVLEEKLDKTSKTNFIKVICFYDRLMYDPNFKD